MVEKNTNHRLMIVQACCLIIITALFVGMAIYIHIVNSTEYTYRMGDLQDGCFVTLQNTKEWSEKEHGYLHGVQYDGDIVNQTSGVISDWRMELKTLEGCHLDSYWSGDMTYNGDEMEILPVDYNKVIEGNKDETFGFVIHTDEVECILDYAFTYHRHVRFQDLNVFWGSLFLVLLYIIVDIVGVVLWVRMQSYQRQQREFINIINQSFLTFANIIDAKDPYTKGHSQRVAVYAKALAEKMGLSEEDQRNIFYTALLHDIGKIGTPDSILKKPGRLNETEREEIQQHVVVGGDIMKDFNAIPGIQDGVRYHHERFDGKGYGTGLKGKEIPLFGRIICVADTYDAMSSSRCYRQKLSETEIIEELKRCTGTQFDPDIVKWMLELIEEKKAPVDVTSRELYQELSSGKTHFSV